MKFKHVKCYKENYPRPQFVRDEWIDLNGKWKFAFDFDGVGENERYFDGFDSDRAINVPFAYQCKASGIGDETLCENIWYERTFPLGDLSGRRVLLHLEGSDWITCVWVNGKFCGKQTGGYHRQTYDVTEACKVGDNLLVIKVNDDYSTEKPRGKQRWKEKNFGCWYVDTSGLYKTVWLETVSETYIDGVKITPDVADKSVGLIFDVAEAIEPETKIVTTVEFDGDVVAIEETPVTGGRCEQRITLGDELHLWEAGNGALYDVKYALVSSGVVFDEVYGYFGMRDIATKNGSVMLNGKELYQRLILDQGYWKDCDLTPPDEKAIYSDIVSMIEMGFNGARKHQKVEDERFLYYADILGYVVWAEMPSMYTFTEKSCAAFAEEWKLAVNQQYNHPCVLCWVPLNESWGVENIRTDKAQQLFADKIYDMTKEIDGMRPVITNDGWEHTKSDLLTIHHYTQDGNVLLDAFDTVDKCASDKFVDHDHGAFAQGYEYVGQPILITEFGGTSFVTDTYGENWGYGDAVKSDGEFVERFSSLIDAIKKNNHVKGFCYTQLSDVYQEVNGLVKFDRTSKIGADIIKKIVEK